MNEKQMQAEELETMELLSGKIEAEPPCGQATDEKAGNATERVGEAVSAAAERVRTKKQE